MHPIERLRWVARAPEGDVTVVVAEAAEALAAFADEPAGLVIACRRLIERRPACGPLWWLSSRMLCALEPAIEADLAAADLARDATPSVLSAELPGGTIVLSAAAEQAALAVRNRTRRADGEPDADRVVVADSSREGRHLLRWLEVAGVPARLVADPARAVSRAALVLLEAQAVGPAGFVAASGSEALARAARNAACPVWLVAGAGRILPGPLYDALARRVAATGAEELPLSLVDEVTGPGGLTEPLRAARRAECPVAPELLYSPSH